MEGSSDAVNDAADRLAEIEKKRSSAIDRSRVITRKTKNMIHAIHTGYDHTAVADDLIRERDGLFNSIGDEPSVLYSAVVQDALGEYAEAFIFAAIVKGVDIPSFDSLGISPQSWVMGLADSIGEIRRMILTYLISGKLDVARELFGRMESMGDAVLGLDVPDAVAPIRRKQDVARGIIEKTRSDITNAVMLAQYKE